MAKSDYINIMTPVCPMTYINLFKADPKYGKFGLTLILDSNIPEHQDFMDELDALHQKAFDKLIGTIKSQRKAYKVKTLRPEEDDDGNETGRFLLKAITTKRPGCFDAALPKPNKLGDDELRGLWSGTEGRVRLGLKASVVTQTKTIGMTYYLNAVQIVTPVYGNDGGGFEGIEGGFSTNTGATSGDNGTSEDEADAADF